MGTPADPRHPTNDDRADADAQALGQDDSSDGLQASSFTEDDGSSLEIGEGSQLPSGRPPRDA